MSIRCTKRNKKAVYFLGGATRRLECIVYWQESSITKFQRRNTTVAEGVSKTKAYWLVPWKYVRIHVNALYLAETTETPASSGSTGSERHEVITLLNASVGAKVSAIAVVLFMVYSVEWC